MLSKIYSALIVPLFLFSFVAGEDAMTDIKGQHYQIYAHFFVKRYLS
jgi:hypothetical protein